MNQSEAVTLFDLEKTPISIEPLGNGLIHKTYAVYAGSSVPAYVLQKINTNVFADLDALEHNIATVTAELERQSLSRGDDLSRAVLRFVPTPDGRLIAHDGDGCAWRMCLYVPESVTVDVVDTPGTARRSAEAFARFHVDLWDLSTESVRATIPDFHNTPLRYKRLQQAVETCHGAASAAEDRRLARAEPALSQIDQRAQHLDRIETGLAAGTLSRHVCHNDTKVNNLLLDRESRVPLCVIDLDTIGPGSPLLDVGDLIRTAAATVSEEEQDLTQVAVDLDCARAIIDGFLSVLGDRLNRAERQLLGFGGWLITMEQAIRYLTDYLLGDPYYGARYPGHNLARAGNQLALARSMEDSLEIPGLDITTSESRP